MLVRMRERALLAKAAAGSPEEFGRLVPAEIVKWGKLIQSAKITAD